MSDRILQVREIAQYPRVGAVEEGFTALLQAGEAGTPYVSILASDFVATALADGGRLLLDSATGAIVFGPPNVFLNVVSGVFTFSAPVNAPSITATFIDAPSITINGVNVATRCDLAANRAASVTSFNLRTGDIMLMVEDILRAGGAPIRDAHFGGWITAPSVWDTRANDDTVATTNWVHRAIHDTGVSSFMGRTGCVTLTTADVNAAYATIDGTYPTAPNPALGDASGRIATTLFVDESLADLHLTISNEQLALLTSTYAPINSPNFTGVPTAPTANPGANTGQLATTAFVHNAIVASTTGVSSFNTRTGAVTLVGTDITGAGGALLNSPAFVGLPTAPTPAPGTNNTGLATTAFVAAAITAAGGVTSFNTRTGVVTLSLADVTGTGVLANTPLTGVPTAPTAATATSTTQLATTAFVQAALATGVTSFMGRTGGVTLLGADISAAGGALINSPSLTGTPTAPTPATSDSSTTLATTAFVHAAITAGAAGVTTFNGRAGAVTLTLADITGAGGAPLASPTFTGTPAGPTVAATDNSTTLATTAFVKSVLGSSPLSVPGWQFTLSGSQSVQAATGTVASLFTVSGSTAAVSANQALTFQNHSQAPIVQVADNTSNSALVGNYLILKNNVSGSPAQISASGSSLQLVPGGSGTVQAPTMTAGDNSTAVATTAFVAAAAVGGIKSVHIQKFTTAGAFTYTPSAGLVACIVEAVGGGGGSGGVTGAAAYVVTGAGGGGGAYARKLLTAAQVGASLSGSVGAGGVLGAAGAAGGNGGDTSLAALMVAKGGTGSGPSSTGGVAQGAAGGLASSSTGDFVVSGGVGGVPFYSSLGASATRFVVGAFAGGASAFAQAVPGAAALDGNSYGGVAGASYGGGAAGPVVNDVAASQSGAAGAIGCVVITEFCSQ